MVRSPAGDWSIDALYSRLGAEKKAANADMPPTASRHAVQAFSGYHVLLPQPGRVLRQ